MIERKSTLAGDFDAATYDDWRALAQAGLKDRAFDTLVSKTLAGVDLQPIYARSVTPDPQPGLAHNGAWQIVQRIDIPDPDAANAQIHDDLAGGADAIELVFSASTTARGAGIAIEDISGMARLLDGVDLERVPLRLCGGHECRHIIALFAGHAQDRGAEMSKMNIRIVFDAITDMAVHGFLNFSLEPAFSRAVDLDEGLLALGLDARFPSPDGRHWHAAGANEAQEIALMLSSALYHLRGLERAGAEVSRFAGKTGFITAADSDQFMTMAKFRALRRVWARIQKEIGVEAAPAHIHAETAWRMMSRRDPHMNVLRGTMAAFAAGVGGADSITVLPFTAALGLPDGFARRLARNTQSILMEESNVHRVADPAAGSGAFEALTEEIAQKAWTIFQGIEAEGGMLRGLEAGRIQAMVRETRDARLARVRRLEEPLIGVSAHPNLKELPVEVLPATPAGVQTSNLRVKLPDPGTGNLFAALIEAGRSGVTLGDMSLSRKSQPQSLPDAVPPTRLAEPFEALRDACDEAREHRDARPRALIAGGGDTAVDARLAAWARRVLQVAGVSVAGDAHDGSDDGIISVLSQSGAVIACLCPANEVSKDAITATINALTQAGVAVIYVTGKAPEANKEAKIALSAYPGCDVVELMTKALERVGIAPEEQLLVMEPGAQA